MDYKPLYLAYKDNGYLGDHKRNEFGMIYTQMAIDNVKVVACPFCGISTSNGEKMLDCISHVQFKCFSCSAIAFSTNDTKIVTYEEVKNVYSSVIADPDVVFHLVKLREIVWVSNLMLVCFSSKENMDNIEIIEFHNDIENFKNENKVDVNFGSEDARKFLKDNKLAKKYKIEYHGDSGNGKNILSLPVDSYNLADMDFCAIAADVVLFAKNRNTILVLFDKKRYHTH